MKKLFFSIVCLFLATTFVAQNNSNVFDTVDQKLDEIWKNSNAPGVSLSVVLPNGEVKTFTRGFADVEKKIPMSATTKMLGGSTGKVFYSVVALQLIDEGKLKLDELIFSKMKAYDWFQRIPNAKTLTVRHLMRHQTGIPRYVFSPDFQKDVLKDANKVWKPEELLSYIFDAKPEFEVGTNFAYSDTNYIILCMLIEKITGNSIYDEVQKRVLNKAGLKNVVPQTKRSYHNIAQGYNAENDPFYPGLQFDKSGKSKYNLQFEWAGGGLVITTHDLAVLGKKIYEGKMFNPKLLEEYFNGVDAGRLGGKWGLGVHIKETPNGTTYGHSGYMPGYITNMVYNAKDKFTVCYQLNTSDRSRLSIMRSLPSLINFISKELNK
ncbi:serine hydrolase domain-containing protein [Pseudotenacibaculum sp. MALMAid0570]|uniref:serine hydrolase domain-containing protein n=1 Tax=Pseudotenacibaculum sp. MALMAid0570 TaxID=3143938 RepID=UPI0032DEFF00